MDPLLALIPTFAVLAGATTYLLLRRDLRRRRAVLAAAVCGVVVGVGFLYTVYLAVLAFLAAVVVYAVGRRLLRVDHALVASAVTFTGLLAASVVAFSLALSTM